MFTGPVIQTNDCFHYFIIFDIIMISMSESGVGDGERHRNEKSGGKLKCYNFSLLLEWQE